MNHSERRRRRPAFEALEGRRLLAAPIAEFPVSGRAADIAGGPDGNLWFTASGNQVGRITPAGQVTMFPIPASSSEPDQITAGPDGNMWFTYGSKFQIGRITTSGVVTVFPTPAGNQSSEPLDLVAGPDGNLWFTETDGKQVGRMTATGQVTEFSVSLAPTGIEAGPDGNLWLTESEPLPPQPGRRDRIGRITPAGQVTEFPFDGFLMSGAAFGPDGNLWFTKGVYVPLAGGSPGAAKRAEFLCRMTPSGQVTEIPLSGFGGGGELTFGPDGNLWYTVDNNAIGRITPAGLAAQFSIPTTNGDPSGIVSGPDGNIWFSERDGARIGRFRVATTDLRLTLPAAPPSGPANQRLTYTISVTNDGPVAATDVVLTADDEVPASAAPVPVTPDNMRSVSASQGTVRDVAGGFVARLGDIPSGATATVTIVVTSASPRTLTTRLAVHANESDPNPANDSATVSTTIVNAPASPPPHVLGLQSVRVKRKGLTAIVVNFDQPMDSGHLSNLGIYHLVSVLKGGKKPRLKAVNLASARYDAASHSVRLSLRKPFKTGTLRLTIDHTAVVAASGMGLAGGDYVATLRA